MSTGMLEMDGSIDTPIATELTAAEYAELLVVLRGVIEDCRAIIGEKNPGVGLSAQFYHELGIAGPYVPLDPFELKCDRSDTRYFWTLSRGAWIVIEMYAKPHQSQPFAFHWLDSTTSIEFVNAHLELMMEMMEHIFAGLARRLMWVHRLIIGLDEQQAMIQRTLDNLMAVAQERGITINPELV